MTMQAILTKYLGPTNHRPGRVRAWCGAGSITVSWDHGQGIEENHRAAWHALLCRLGWEGSTLQWVQGSIPTGFVFVRAERVR